MEVFTAVIKLNVVAASLPRPLFLEVYALYYSCEFQTEEPPDFSVLLEYIDISTNDVIKKLQHEFAPISQRVGVILDTVVEPLLAFVSSRQFLNCSDIFSLGGTTIAHDSVLYTKMTSERLLTDIRRCARYFEWATYGLLVCPMELQRHNSLTDVMRVVLSESLILHVFGNVSLFLHEQFQMHVQSSMNEYIKQSNKHVHFSKRMVSECYDLASRHSAMLHRDRRISCIGHLKRIKLKLFEAIGSLDAVTLDLSVSDIAVVFAIISFGHYEMKWFYNHADITQSDIAQAFAQSTHSSTGAIVNVVEEANEGTDIGVLMHLLFDVEEILHEHMKPLCERIRLCLSNDLKLLKSSMATVLSAPDLPSPSSKGLLRQIWSEVVAYTGMSEDSASQALSMLKATELNWLRFTFETSSAAGTAAIHDIESRVVVALQTYRAPIEVQLPDSIGCFEFLSHIVDSCMPMLQMEWLLSSLNDMSYLLGVSFDRHEKLERRMVSSRDGQISTYIVQPVRLYSRLGHILDEHRARTGSSEKLKLLQDQLVSQIERFITNVEDRVEILLANLYKEGLPSLDRQLTPKQAALRMVSAGTSTANSRRMRRASVAPQLQQYGANTKPLPGFESHKANRSSLLRMTRELACLRGIIQSIEAFQSNDDKKLASEIGQRIQVRVEKIMIEHIERTATIDVMASGNITANNEGYKTLVCKPSVLALELRQLRSLLSVFDGCSFINPSLLLRKAIYREGADNNSSLQEDSLLEVYTEWYINMILDSKTMDVLYNPVLDRFENVDDKRDRSVNAVDYTSSSELKELINIFGVSIIMSIENKALQILRKYIRDIDASLHANSHILKDVNFVNLRGANQIDKFYETVANLSQTDQALKATIGIGAIIHFQNMMSSAARELLREGSDVGIVHIVDDMSDLTKGLSSLTYIKFCHLVHIIVFFDSFFC